MRSSSRARARPAAPDAGRPPGDRLSAMMAARAEAASPRRRAACRAQRARGHHDVVVRVVVRRERVARAAEALDQRVDGAGRPRRRALEQHVLEVVGETELALVLITAADAYPELRRDDFSRAVLLR